MARQKSTTPPVSASPVASSRTTTGSSQATSEPRRYGHLTLEEMEEIDRRGIARVREELRARRAQKEAAAAQAAE